ncbi:MAG: ATP-dependent helicase, partial [Acidimicrobiia bacterium]|nr:ATP-dependent helicase [Acidimicrobiia bacterium]
YAAASLPDPRSEAWADAAVDEARDLLELSGGRGLVLTTSYRMLDRFAERLAGSEVRLLVQGELPKQALVAAFEEEETSVLVATMGFWEGLDIPGRSLEVVVIDKLPFPRPDDPLWTARREVAEQAGLSSFGAVDLPRAAVLLAQGAGRLIRSVEARGLVAVLDPRLATKSYGSALVRALPDMSRTADPEVAREFVRRMRSD